MLLTNRRRRKTQRIQANERRHPENDPREVLQYDQAVAANYAQQFENYEQSYVNKEYMQHQIF